MLLKMGADHIPEKATQLRALYAWMWAWPGKKTLFMGSEFGQSNEWAYDKSLDWHLLQYLDHEGIRLLVADLNEFYRRFTFVAESDYDSESFRWINSTDGNNSVISFVRFGTQPGQALVVVANLTPVPRPSYRVGVPLEGTWREVLNTNLKRYGGAETSRPAEVESKPIKWDGQPHALDLSLSGMSVAFFLPETALGGLHKIDAVKPAKVTEPSA
jgi:1,4-alpha-glucan branching enzyme